MKRITLMAVSVFIAGMMTCAANAASLGCIDVQKVFSGYEKTKKAQEQIKKKEKSLQEEIEKKQKQVEKEKEKGASDDDLRKMVTKFEKELEPKRSEILDSQKKTTQEIQSDIVKASQEAAKKAGIEMVLDKQVFITGGIDLTDQVLAILNKKL